VADININTVNKYFGDVHVIKDISLDVKSQSFTVLVGPSGCGKSTMLRMIAGLEDINSGTISIDGQVVNDLPPKERNIAMVFQSYALYPHMTVFDNMAFGLKLEKRSKDEINAAMKEASEGPMKGILEFQEDPIVSVDIIHNSHSSIYDQDSLMVQGKTIKILSWYDNEWGYSCRVVDLINLFNL